MKNDYEYIVKNLYEAAEVLEDLVSRPRSEKYVADVVKLLPVDVWCDAKKEVYETGSSELWQMCLVAIEHLGEFWEDEH